jgi:hypothetical protein
MPLSNGTKLATYEVTRGRVRYAWFNSEFQLLLRARLNRSVRTSTPVAQIKEDEDK